MIVHKRLECTVGCLLVACHVIHLHLGQRELFALPLGRFQAVERLYHLRRLLLLLVVVVVGIKIFVGLYRFGIVAGSNVVLCHTLHVGGVVGIQLGGLEQIGQRRGIVFHRRIVHGQIIIHFRSLRINVPGMLKEIEGSVMPARTQLPCRFQKEVVKPPTSINRQTVLLCPYRHNASLMPPRRRQCQGQDRH